MRAKTKDDRAVVKVSAGLHQQVKTICDTTGMKIEFFVTQALERAVALTKGKAR